MIISEKERRGKEKKRKNWHGLISEFHMVFLDVF